MSADDLVKIIDAVGDSWPAAIVVAVVVIGFVAWRALPRLKEITELLKSVQHEFTNNSGKTLKDSVDRIEATTNETKASLEAHIEADEAWKVQAEDLLTRVDPQ